jgi:hypothetical protein
MQMSPQYALYGQDTGCRNLFSEDMVGKESSGIQLCKIVESASNLTESETGDFGAGAPARPGMGEPAHIVVTDVLIRDIPLNKRLTRNRVAGNSLGRCAPEGAAQHATRHHSKTPFECLTRECH